MRRRQFIAGLGGAAAWPLASRAQQPSVPVIGYVSGWSQGDATAYVASFRRGLSDVGYVEGQNVTIEYRWAEGHFDRLSTLIVDLVQRQVAVIVTANTTASALAAKAATQTIPIVFLVGSNPVDIGLVASLNRPGGNLTGVTDLQTTVVTKRLGLLHELVPAAKVIAILVNPTSRVLAEADAREAATAAATLGLRLLVLGASSPAEIEASFTTLLGEHAGGLLTNGDSYFMTQRTLLAALTARHAVPTIFTYPENAEAGGLMSYGTNIIDTTRQIGVYAGRILKRSGCPPCGGRGLAMSSAQRSTVSTGSVKWGCAPVTPRPGHLDKCVIHGSFRGAHNSGRTPSYADPRHHLSADRDGRDASHALMSATGRGGLNK
jgi:putative ABC transport system substrate-binding protein